MHLLITLTIGLSVSALVSSAPSQHEESVFLEKFEAWKTKYNKWYATKVEENTRFKTFVKNAKMIEKHNREYQDGLKTYSVKLNKFADIDFEEFKATYLSPAPINYNVNVDNTTFAVGAGSMPPYFNWAEMGFVTPVKDQGECNASYAFAAAGVIEAQRYKQTGELVSISAQQPISCLCGCVYSDLCANYIYPKNQVWDVFGYWRNGVNSDDVFPYSSYFGTVPYCVQRPYSATVINSYVVSPFNEYELQKAVAKNGPIASYIDATSLFQFYNGGVFYDPNCSKHQPNHYVLVTGWGTNFWIVKNSWGTDWGMGGYIWMHRGWNNCGIAYSNWWAEIGNLSPIENA